MEITNKARSRSHTCGDPHCIAVLFVFPHLRKPLKSLAKPALVHDEYPWLPALVADRVNSYQESASDRDWALLLHVDTSDWAFGDEHMTADLRGLGTPDHMRTWSKTSRVRVGLRARTQPGAVFLHLRRRQSETSADAVKRDWFASGGGEQMFDVFLAWRCRCPVETHYEVIRIDDLPDAPGPHGNCPGCGATALLVEVLP